MCSPTARAGHERRERGREALPRPPHVRWNSQLQPLVEPQPSQT